MESICAWSFQYVILREILSAIYPFLIYLNPPVAALADYFIYLH